VNGRLAPGSNAIGTLICTNNVTFNNSGAAVIEINKAAGTRDLLAVGRTLTYGGTLQVTNLAGPLANGDSFKIFNAGAYAGSFNSLVLPVLSAGLTWTTSSLRTNGTIAIVKSVSSIPTNIAYTISGNNLTLSWPVSHIGWTLQTQTNPLSAGLSSIWFPVPGSANTNFMTFPVNPTNPTVFYRLSWP